LTTSIFQLARAQLHHAPEAALPGRVEEAPPFDLAGEGARMDPAAIEPAVVHGGAEHLQRREDALHVHVEPAIDGLLDEVAAHDHEQERGRRRHQDEDDDEPHAEAGAEHAAPPLP
jgi:hypothetical protein